MVWCILLHLGYVICPNGDHAEVSRTPRLSYASCLRHTQGVRRDKEESLDCLLHASSEFHTGRFRDSLFGLLCVASWYDLPPRPLKQT